MPRLKENCEAEARDVAPVTKTHTCSNIKIYQYQEITPSTAVSTVSNVKIEIQQTIIKQATISYQRRT